MGMKITPLGNTKPILFNTKMVTEVSCVVAQSAGVTVGSKKIVKAGTPIKIDLKNRTTVATTASTDANAVVLNDTDVTDGDGNASGVIFGFINYAHLDTDVQTLVDAATGLTGKVTFIK